MTSDDGSARVTVAPDGAPAFEIHVIGAMRAQLGGERDGLIAVSAPLAFTATLRERTFQLARSLELAGAMVHLRAGARVNDVSGNRHGVTASVRLDAELVAEIAGLEFPCDALALHDSDAAPLTAPASRPSKLGPRRDTVTLRAQPGAGAAITLSFPEGNRGAFGLIERRGPLQHLVLDGSDGWVSGWVDKRDLSRAKPGRDRRDELFGFDAAPTPPGGYSGPAKVAAGTPVYATSAGVGRWAVVTSDSVLDVVAQKDAAWVALEGSLRVGTVTSVFAFDLPGHAWVPAGAVEFPDVARGRP